MVAKVFRDGRQEIVVKTDQAINVIIMVNFLFDS